MKWKPIETAPLDRYVDVWVGSGVRVTDAFWGVRSQDEEVCKEFGFSKIGWCHESDDGWVYPIEPTHWMPIPGPPQR